jgi:arrestin-related trafficking adapter 3/6
VKPVVEEKPLASGNGINVGIQLTEPVLFLQGFEQTESSERSTAMLRGTLQLKVTKPAKVKAITLKFRGKAVTKWPEGKNATAIWKARVDI